MAIVIEDRSDQWKRFVRGLGEFSRGPRSVVAGIQENASNNGKSVAEYATFNEMGGVIHRNGKSYTVPSRPFMRLYFESDKSYLERFSENAITQVLLGRATAAQAFSAIGLKMQQGIRDQILKSEDYVPNSPKTIALKGSDKPLIDHAILLNSITFALRDD